MTTIYEFVVETLDFYEGCGDDPDIIDSSGFDTLDEAQTFAQNCEEPWRICLRRDTGDDLEGITDRFCAYPNELGILPENMESAMGFDDGPKIPKKFRNVVFPIDERIMRN